MRDRGRKAFGNIDMMIAGDTVEHVGIITVMTALPLASFSFEAREKKNYIRIQCTLCIVHVAACWLGYPPGAWYALLFIDLWTGFRNGGWDGRRG